MQHYTAAQQAAAQATRARTRMLNPVGLRDDMRESGEFVLKCSGYRFECILKPHGRDVRLWHVLRDGELWLPSTGLERMWRKVQSDMAQPLGRRHWDE